MEFLRFSRGVESNLLLTILHKVTVSIYTSIAERCDLRVAVEESCCVTLDRRCSPGEAVAGGQGALALLSWGHSDGVVRLKRRRDAPPHLLLHVPPLDQVALARRLLQYPQQTAFL